MVQLIELARILFDQMIPPDRIRASRGKLTAPAIEAEKAHPSKTDIDCDQGRNGAGALDETIYFSSMGSSS